MSIASNGLSVSRRQGLITRATQDDLLILDLSSNDVICLTGPAAQVWRALEANSSIELSDAEVAGAIAELSAAGLVELGGFDRRRFLQRSALVGAGAVGSVVVMQLPAAATVVSSPEMPTYDLGTILGTYTAANKSATTAAGPDSAFTFYVGTNLAPQASEYSIATLTAKTFDGYYSTGSNPRPRFVDINQTTGTNDNDGIGYVFGQTTSTSAYPGFSSGSQAAVAIDKNSSNSAAVVAFAVPSGYTTVTFNVTVDPGTVSNPNATGTTMAQFVEPDGTVYATEAVGTLGGGAVTLVNGGFSYSNGDVYYVVVYDTTPKSNTYPIIGLTFTATLSS